MIGGVLEHLERAARQLSPFLVSVVLTTVTALPFHIPGYGQVAANAALISVFYWSVHRRNLFPAYAAFGLGLWQDVLVGAPIGMNALLLLFVSGTVAAQRTFFVDKSFAVIWWSFSLVALATSTASWAVASALNAIFLDPVPALFQAALTVAAFPFAAWFLAQVQHMLLRLNVQ